MTATLECQTKVFGLRTDSLQLNLDHMLQGIEKEAKPQKSNFNFDLGRRPEEDIQPGDASDMVFNGGNEFIFEDDSYLNFDIEEIENQNNPAFSYLARIFDKEGARGLQLNNVDV